MSDEICTLISPRLVNTKKKKARVGNGEQKQTTRRAVAYVKGWEKGKQVGQVPRQKHIHGNGWQGKPIHFGPIVVVGPL